MGGHAAVERARNPEVHELASLTLFALKDYRGAAMEAHAALMLGPPIDWPTLYSYYENVDAYTSQLRALEKFVRDQPKALEGHFLLGYHFIMAGHKDAAKKELQEAITLEPRDKLAQEMLKALEARCACSVRLRERQAFHETRHPSHAGKHAFLWRGVRAHIVSDTLTNLIHADPHRHLPLPAGSCSSVSLRQP